MFSLFFLVFAGLSCTVSGDLSTYTYIKEFDAFYKLHNGYRGLLWNSTFAFCKEEKAKLFYPTARDEWNVVKKLMEASPAPIASSSIFVGSREQFHDCKFSVIKVSPKSTPRWNFEASGEGNCIILDVETGSLHAEECDEETTNLRPFVCKKTIRAPACLGDGYEYSNKTNKCYKYINDSMTWCRAMETCLNEGATLLTIESGLETNVISLITPNRYHQYYIGARGTPSGDVYDIKGHKQSLVGFYEWNFKAQECVMYWGGVQMYLIEEQCNVTHSFVCEKTK